MLFLIVPLLALPIVSFVGPLSFPLWSLCVVLCPGPYYAEKGTYLFEKYELIKELTKISAHALEPL